MAAIGDIWSFARERNQPVGTPARTDGETIRGVVRADHGADLYVFIQRSWIGP